MPSPRLNTQVSTMRITVVQKREVLLHSSFRNTFNFIDQVQSSAADSILTFKHSRHDSSAASLATGGTVMAIHGLPLRSTVSEHLRPRQIGGRITARIRTHDFVSFKTCFVLRRPPAALTTCMLYATRLKSLHAYDISGKDSFKDQASSGIELDTAGCETAKKLPEPHTVAIAPPPDGPIAVLTLIPSRHGDVTTTIDPTGGFT
ncbi:hypothetical protein AC579_9128 [Pseudocercospora musae]|uniref:Uncharacterized protein n=1 Tax=Pseudocercospora musae TaxID=113226 RepID=A0A139IIY6_9PEZI|nr:hypothetical protein AC579_9128 [Pseudocercospora musae]